ncbi:hypothetical protein GIB67_027911 [Kingdonia uniflora]|uniref:R13L1/DRL21-like LRR repeat region domain-containing protein n=1 Tax=Kingdonia uniflora TaxID=39325 RepID=A0A7J7LGI3_9MAGN|nr:hypothetical protein GIB67_027911 [Kingdonia uniflora]
MEGLQPHPNLEILEMSDYRGSKLPCWMSNDFMLMWKVRILRLYGCNKCIKLPFLGKLPLLEELVIMNIHQVKCIGSEFYGIGTQDFLGISENENENDNDNDATTSNNKRGSSGGKLTLFPSLIALYLGGMKELEEWELPFERSDVVQLMLRLHTLRIIWAPKLKALPALGRLESLEYLFSVKHIGLELFGISDDDIIGTSRVGESLPMIVFPKLKTLDFRIMGEWEMIVRRGDEQNVSFILPWN